MNMQHKHAAGQAAWTCGIDIQLSISKKIQVLPALQKRYLLYVSQGESA
jgi:hypothetical protein